MNTINLSNCDFKLIITGDLVVYHAESCIVVNKTKTGLILCNTKSYNIHKTFKAKDVLVVSQVKYTFYQPTIKV